MSRTPHNPAELGDTAGPMPEGHTITLAGEQETNSIEAEMAFNAAEAIGKMRALEFSETVSARAKIEVFINLAKSKAYKALFITDKAGNRKRVSDIDELCDHFFEKSARRMRQQAANYHLLGGDLFEASQAIGFRQQDYSALKALPADDQDVIKQAMRPETDRVQILDLMQELSARHASEKAALAAKAKEAEDTAAARDDVIKRKESKISELEVRAATAERRQADFSEIEKRGYECAPLHDAINETMVAMLKLATQVKHLVEEVGGELVTEECFHAVLLPIKRALEISAHNRLHIDLDTLFDAGFDAPLDELQARAAGLPTEALQ